MQPRRAELNERSAEAMKRSRREGGKRPMSSFISRRAFAKAAACASLSVAGGWSRKESRSAEVQSATNGRGPFNDREFAQGFYWGRATAAFQIEGARNEDGKGLSIRDIYAHTPGKIMDGTNADVAIDHYQGRSCRAAPQLQVPLVARPRNHHYLHAVVVIRRVRATLR
jgi:hypothetical protein